MPSHHTINRREFCKTSLLTGAAVYGAALLGAPTPLAAQAKGAMPDLVAVRNGEPDVMFDKAMDALGGMTQFVQRGQIVVVKPNIGWNRAPETGANTNPLLVKRIIEHCFNAGAKKVYVFDNAVSSSLKTYKTSGLEATANAAGATVVPSHSEQYYQSVEIPGASVLKKTKVHEVMLEANVVINVPVLKHHSSSSLTIAMKNLMGVVWDRQEYHRKGLHDCIADFCLYHQPTLNVVDAYRVTMAHGPSNARLEDLDLKKSLLVGRDIVMVDAAATKLFGLEPERVRYIQLGYEKKIGTLKLDQANIHRIVL